MNDILLIACGAGLKDGLNPCLFMACAVFIIGNLWLKSTFAPLAGFRVFFALAYFLGALFFNFSFGQLFILKKGFILTAQVLYLALSIWAFVLGILFLRDWFLIYRGAGLPAACGQKKLTLSSAAGLWLATAILAGILSALSTLWPIDKYILLLGNLTIGRGQWGTALPLLACYTAVSMWPLWCVWAFLSIRKLSSSWLKIVAASVFFTASSCMVLLFK